MTKLPEKPLSLFPLIWTIVTAYFSIFRNIIGLVIISSVGHLVIPFLYLKNHALAAMVGVAFVFLIWFLYPAILNRAYYSLSGNSISIPASLQMAKRRYLYILGSNVVYFAIFIFLGLIIFILDLTLDLVNLHPIFLALSVIIVITTSVYFYFSIPEIALGNISILGAFEKSARLVRKNLIRTALGLAFVFFVVLGFEALGILFTGQNRLILFVGYHFILQCIFYPLVISSTIILLNDLKLRYPLRMKRHATHTDSNPSHL